MLVVVWSKEARAGAGRHVHLLPQGCNQRFKRSKRGEGDCNSVMYPGAGEAQEKVAVSWDTCSREGWGLHPLRRQGKIW